MSPESLSSYLAETSTFAVDIGSVVWAAGGFSQNGSAALVWGICFLVVLGSGIGLVHRALSHPKPPLSTTGGQGGVNSRIDGDVTGTAVQVGTVIGGIRISAERHATPAPHTEMEAVLSTAVPVREALPRRLGVHAARPGTDDSDLPPYVPRDADELIQRRVRTAAERGGAVLLVGDSTAGKSRTLLHALQQTVPERHLVVPFPDTDLPALADRMKTTPPEGESERWVLWLDDLDRYLGRDERGLTEGVLRVLTAARTVLAATMRSEYYDAYLDASGDVLGEMNEGADEARLLRRIDVVELDRVWSLEEVRCARETPDQRLREAAANHGVHGIAEYLAAGPDLLAEWRRARRHTGRGGHPRGHAMVAAAIDLARTDLRTVLTRELIWRAHSAYLTDAAALHPEPLDEAWDWARKIRLGASGLLVPEYGKGKEGWRPFDYLVEAADTSIPEATWQAAFDYASDTGEQIRVLSAADRLGEREFAYSGSRSLAYTGHVGAMRLLIHWNRRSRRFREAEEWSRRAVAAGSVGAMRELGHALRMQGNADEAEEWLRKAVDHNDRFAMNGLYNLLREQGRTEEALSWYRKFALSGDPLALCLYGRMLADQGRPDLSEQWYREAIDHGLDSAMVDLGGLLQEQGRFDEAEEWFLKAAENGDENAAAALGIMLVECGRPVEAEPWLRRAVASAVPGIEWLAVALMRQGKDEDAAAWMRECGDEYKASLVSLILFVEGEGAEMARWEKMMGEWSDSDPGWQKL